MASRVLCDARAQVHACCWRLTDLRGNAKNLSGVQRIALRRATMNTPRTTTCVPQTGTAWTTCCRGLRAVVLFAAVGCSSNTEPTPAPEKSSEQNNVAYDVRRLRPRDDERLAAMFERLRKQAVAEGKQVAVLFSADWCEPCRRLELELANQHPEKSIGHVRVFEFKEEEWEAATRMEEFNNLRRRWYAPINSYPVLVLLNENGDKREEMKEAIERLEQAGEDPTLVAWFAGVRRG